MLCYALDKHHQSSAARRSMIKVKPVSCNLLAKGTEVGVFLPFILFYSAMLLLLYSFFKATFFRGKLINQNCNFAK